MTEADFVLAIGCRMFNEISGRARRWFPDNAFVVHVNADVAKVEEMGNADWSASWDPADFLTALAMAVQRTPAASGVLAARRRRLDAARDRRRQTRPGPYGDVAQVIGRMLDSAYIVDESVSGNHWIMSALKGVRGDHFISTTGGSLGWATGAAVGVALASREPVICTLGDGAFFFGLHGLWPAKLLKLPITFVVLDNGGFGSTRYFQDRYAETLGEPRPISYIGSDFGTSGPSVVDATRGFGIPAISTSSIEELERNLTGLVADRSNGPHLLRVPI